MHQRAKIRNYVIALLKKKVSVGGRVFSNRPDPMRLEEFPAVLVGYTGESAEVRDGDRFGPETYGRNLDMLIGVSSTESEDALDQLVYEVERALFEDWTLEKELTGYDPNGESLALCGGLSLKSTVPYTIDSDGELPVYGAWLTWEVPYITSAATLEKFGAFESYSAELVKTDDDLPDQILIAAEGDL